jgi:hypothetical protein
VVDTECITEYDETRESDEQVDTEGMRPVWREREEIHSFCCHEHSLTNRENQWERGMQSSNKIPGGRRVSNWVEQHEMERKRVTADGSKRRYLTPRDWRGNNA